MKSHLQDMNNFQNDRKLNLIKISFFKYLKMKINDVEAYAYVVSD